MKTRHFPQAMAALAVVLGLIAAPAALAQDAPPPFDAKQREALDEMMRQYILEHPEVVVEALHRYEQQQRLAEAKRQQESIVALAGQLTADPRDPVIGNPQGDITLVEFFDYRCPYCERMSGTLAQLIEEDPKLRVVMKEFPILSPESAQAARAALAAARQGKYKAFHFALMAGGGGFTDDEILMVAEQVGLDSETLQRDMQDPAIEAVLRDNHAMAEKIGITGTPAFIVGDTLIPGALSLEELRAKIAAARANSG